MGFAPTQRPARQLSDWVHGFPSSQAAPSNLLGLLHVPVIGLHVPGSWHWSGTGQVRAAPATQRPAWQVSPRVQELPSLQRAPSGLSAKLQVPSPLQLPACWHWDGAWQANNAPAQTPALQASPLVHANPSLQAVPSGLLGLLQRPVIGEHVPAVWH